MERDPAEIARFNAPRVTERALDELLGICKGIISDRHVNADEAQYLDRWLAANPEAAQTWPANVLHRRLKRIFADGRADPEERDELRDLLMQYAGDVTPGPNKDAARNYANADAIRAVSRIPFNDPMPEVIFAGQNFCFTGAFAFGTRNACQQAVHDRNGSAQANPTKKTDFLVVGIIGNENWIHSTHGRKIEQAAELRQQGMRVKIVSEEHWVKFL